MRARRCRGRGKIPKINTQHALVGVVAAHYHLTAVAAARRPDVTALGCEDPTAIETGRPPNTGRRRAVNGCDSAVVADVCSTSASAAGRTWRRRASRDVFRRFGGNDLTPWPVLWRDEASSQFECARSGPRNWPQSDWSWWQLLFCRAGDEAPAAFGDLQLSATRRTRQCRGRSLSRSVGRDDRLHWPTSRQAKAIMPVQVRLVDWPPTPSTGRRRRPNRTAQGQQFTLA